MTFDKTKYIQNMKPHTNKLVAYFEKKGITFQETDGDLDNVIFKSKDKFVKISHHSFYRFSGIAQIYKENDKNLIEAVPVTDAMYMDVFMKPIIETHFQIK